jgi:ABC-type protease/lipase transport system fused ATPase/permease subunit
MPFSFVCYLIYYLLFSIIDFLFVIGAVVMFFNAIQNCNNAETAKKSARKRSPQDNE